MSPCKFMLYSGDLNNELVRYSNGPKLFDRRMVRYSSHGLNSELLVRYSGHGLNNELIVRYSNGCISLDCFAHTKKFGLYINSLG